jgi:hypothetical protein
MRSKRKASSYQVPLGPYAIDEHFRTGGENGVTFIELGASRSAPAVGQGARRARL